MKPTTVPLICGIALAAISAAGFSHWWSIHTVAAAFQSGIKVPGELSPVKKVNTALQIASQPPAQQPKTSVAAAELDATEKKFFEALVQKMSSIENQNRDLVDQLAETNRDVIQLGFRVDTHSESFRPLLINEEPSDTTYEEGPGVLPPRAEPVSLPFEE